MDYVREHVTDPAKVDYRPMNAFLLPPPWHRGRAMVIGDAAHTTTPHLATGAGIAIEDAVVLAELIASDASRPNCSSASWRGASIAAGWSSRPPCKFGEMEKDKTIPIQAHFDLMTTTFRQLAAPI